MLGFSIFWKAFAGAALVIAVGRLAKSAGPVLTGVLVTLPSNAGPGLFFIGLEMDAGFVAESTLFTMAGLGPVLIYITVFMHLARFGRFFLALAGSLVAWCLSAWLLVGHELSLAEALACVAGGAVLSFVFNRRFDALETAVPMPAGWRYLIMRGVLAGVYVVGTNVIGLGLGPTLVASTTDYILADPNQVHISLTIVSCVVAPVAMLLLMSGMRALGQWQTQQQTA